MCRLMFRIANIGGNGLAARRLVRWAACVFWERVVMKHLYTGQNSLLRRAACAAVVIGLGGAAMVPRARARGQRGPKMFNAHVHARRAPVRISVVRRQLHQLDDGLAVLLAESTNSGTPHQATIAARITYRVVLRHLLKTSQRTSDVNLRAALRLKEAILALGLPDFDNIVKKMASASAPAHAAALLKAIEAFNKAGAKANAAIHNIGGVDAYLVKLLAPLEPLFVAQSRNIGVPDVYPAIPHKHRPMAVATAAPTPAISQTLQALQTANISQQMRQALANVLTGIRAQLADPKKAAAAKAYYRLILSTLRRAARLNASRILPSGASTYLDHQLFLGLLLFKDKRTRRGGGRRLTEVGNVAAALKQLQATQFPAAVRPVLGVFLADALLELRRPGRRAQGAADLADLRNFINQYNGFRGAQRLPVSGATQTAVSTLKRVGLKAVNGLPDTVKEDGYRQGLMSVQRTLGAVVADLHRLGAMPAAAARAQLYHPQPRAGVPRKMLRWAHSMATHPLGANSGATGFDRFERMLAVLDSLQSAVPQNLSPSTKRKLAGAKYAVVVRGFLTLRKNLINDLARRHKATGPLIQKLQRDRRLFLATQAAAALRASNGGLKNLNRWAQWQLPPAAMRMVNHVLRKSLRRQYQRAARTAGKYHAKKRHAHRHGRHVRLPVIPFHMAGPAARKLGRMCLVLSPALTGKTRTWVDSYARALEPAPGSAYFRAASTANATACLRFTQAASNNRRGSRRIAGPLLIKGFAALAGAPVRPYSGYSRP